MNVLGGLGNATGSVASTLMWALLIVTAATGIVVLIGILISKFIAGGKQAIQPVHPVTACGIKGHRYQVHGAGWRCATCGEGALLEGGLSDPATVVPAATTDAPISAPRAA